MIHTDFQSLRREMAGELYDDRFRRYMLATDGSIFLREPCAVAYPKNTDDVVSVVKFAAGSGLAVHPRGAGSGLCGSALGKGIVIDFTRHMNRLMEIDMPGRTFTCEPGYRAGELEHDLEGTGLFFPPDPSSGEFATFGGMFGTNASGAHSVKYGNVSDYIMDAEVVLSDGCVITLSHMADTARGDLPPALNALWQLYVSHQGDIEGAYPAVRYNVCGYNLRGLVRDNRLRLEKLFSGAEGTLGVVTRLSFRLLKKPAYDSLVVAFFDHITPAAEAVQKILPMGPSGIEIMDKSLLKLARESDKALQKKIPGDIDNLLLIEFDAENQEACTTLAEKVQHLLSSENLTQQIHLAVSDTEKANFWAVRKAAVPILYKLKGRKKSLALMEDAAIPTDRLVDYFNEVYALLERHDVDFVIFGHIAKGLLHTRPLLDLKDSRDVEMMKTLADEAFDLIDSLGGAVSGEHGDGRLRSAYIRRQYPEIYGLFLETKRLLDEKNLFNPEIKNSHDPRQMQTALRYGTAYAATDPGTVNLKWPEGFISEVEKCHGCSKCTTITTATRMCPVFKCTRDESAAPKAKANLLRGLISGALADRSLFERSFQYVMDRCAGCGSCFKECPSNVNIPKMAMEAKARYIERFGPSIENRLLTNLELAGRFTRQFSPLVQGVRELPIIKKSIQHLTGLSACRSIPDFPKRSFFDRISGEEGRGGRRVLYFAGCYTGYIRPEIGMAAVKVLTHLGMQVVVPPQHCCGLPMLAKGMAKKASIKVGHNLKKWGRLLSSVDHIVVTCSSCGYALMADWEYLADVPEIRMVQKKVIHVSELINRNGSRLRLEAKAGKIAYHVPCHLKIQPNAECSMQMLSNVPEIEMKALESHCCGMIGSWGMSEANYTLSKTMGMDLAVSMEKAQVETGVTDCPTCRMQMEAFGATPVRHPVEIVAARLG